MKNIFLFFICLFLFTGCAANKLLSSYSDTGIEQYTLSKVLVVGVAKDETKRRIYEDTFTESLTKKGITATPSYAVSKQSIEPNKQTLSDVITKTAAKTVLITHLVGVNVKEHYQPGSNITYNGNSYDDLLYDYYPFVYNSISLPGSSISTTRVVLETNLYDVQTEKLLWSARTESIDPVMTKKYYQKLIDIFLEDLQKNNFLKK